MTKRIAGFPYSPAPTYKLDLVEIEFIARFDLAANGAVSRSYALRAMDPTPGMLDGFPTLGISRFYRFNPTGQFLAVTSSPADVARRMEAQVAVLFADYEVVAARFMGALRAAANPARCPLALYFTTWIDTEDQWRVRSDARIQLVQNADSQTAGDLLRSWNSPVPGKPPIYEPAEFDASNPLFAPLARASAGYDQELLDFTGGAAERMTKFLQELLTQAAA